MSNALPIPAQKTAYERLTRRQRRFVDALVSGSKGSEAARSAGYSGLYPHVIAYKWSRRADVAAAISEREEQLLEDVGVRAHKVLEQMLAIATLDPRKLVDAEGRAIPLHKLDAQTAAAIASVEVEEISSNGETGVRHKLRFWDKVKAGERLGQFKKLWDTRPSVLNVDARSVTLHQHGADSPAVRAVDALVTELSSLGTEGGAAAADPHGSVLPPALRDGAAGRGSPVDVPAHPRSAGEP